MAASKLRLNTDEVLRYRKEKKHPVLLAAKGVSPKLEWSAVFVLQGNSAPHQRKL